MKEEREKHVHLNQQILKKMKEAGLRLTQSRIKILELLEETQKSLSPSEVYMQLQKKFKSSEFDRVTVYRIIEKFKELEIVHAVGDGKYIYCTHQACSHDKHFIAICSRCGSVKDVGGTAKTLQVLASFLEKEEKFQMTNDSIVIRGLCQKCR